MARTYKHIQSFEKEIAEMAARGMTHREIGEALGFTREQVKGCVKRLHEKQRRLEAGEAVKRPDRPAKDSKTAQGFLYLAAKSLAAVPLTLHSDTSNEYNKLKEDLGITQSMSGRGNPYDNALAENFFSILKTEFIHRVKLKTFEEARLLIDDYIYFYNHQRIQLKTKLTPLEKRSQFVA